MPESFDGNVIDNITPRWGLLSLYSDFCYKCYAALPLNLLLQSSKIFVVKQLSELMNSYRVARYYNFQMRGNYPDNSEYFYAETNKKERKSRIGNDFHPN
ncbi:MAG: hypothetical protein HGA37_05090 [Lentimicrobium sp.]|nr:hypothetical protein [Lentimicrobium sp.]